MSASSRYSDGILTVVIPCSTAICRGIPRYTAVKGNYRDGKYRAIPRTDELPCADALVVADWVAVSDDNVTGNEMQN
eukprot:21178-Heterococcus_DN1.PRE.2